MCRVSERNAAGEENSTGEDETTVAGAMLPHGGLPPALATTWLLLFATAVLGIVGPPVVQDALSLSAHAW